MEVRLEQPPFDVDLVPVEGGKEFDRVRTFYQATKGSNADVRHFDVRRVFRLCIRDMDKAFNARALKEPNTWELWHDTKASEMLSILKAGLMVPPASGPHAIARMFGDGLYFSDQSSEVLRCATGVWGGGGTVERTFMFLAKVAMGKFYVSRNSIPRIPLGYDSCFVQAGEPGVQNNRMIVYDRWRVNPIRLVEFTPYGK